MRAEVAATQARVAVILDQTVPKTRPGRRFSSAGPLRETSPADAGDLKAEPH